MIRIKDDGILVSHLQMTVRFCSTNTTIIVRQSKSPEDRDIGKRCVPLWSVLDAKLQEILPDEDDKR